MSIEYKRFPDFGKELRRPFTVRTECYDCAALYEGCEGKKASAAKFDCPHYQRLPDVQPWPEKVFVPRPVQAKANRNRSEAAKKRDRAEAGTFEPVREQSVHASVPSTHPDRKAKQAQVNAGARQCECGAALPKGKRYCDVCRAQRRRATMREYMQRRRGGSTEAHTSPESRQKGDYATAVGRTPVERTMSRVPAKKQRTV